jgi:hypothetical protein
LDGLDIKIVRFGNDDVLKNISKVLNDLQNKIKQINKR